MSKQIIWGDQELKELPGELSEEDVVRMYEEGDINDSHPYLTYYEYEWLQNERARRNQPEEQTELLIEEELPF